MPMAPPPQESKTLRQELNEKRKVHPMLADEIAQMIEDMLNEAGGSLDLRRNDMAARLGCVPSQISYVISSRFTPQRGYVIESRRGGGGYIRIVRKQMSRSEYLMHFFAAIGESIDEAESAAYLNNLAGNGFLSAEGYTVARAALSDSALSALPAPVKNMLRAQIFRHIILGLMG